MQFKQLRADFIPRLRESTWLRHLFQKNARLSGPARLNFLSAVAARGMPFDENLLRQASVATIHDGRLIFDSFLDQCMTRKKSCRLAWGRR